MWTVGIEVSYHVNIATHDLARVTIHDVNLNYDATLLLAGIDFVNIGIVTLCSLVPDLHRLRMGGINSKLVTCRLTLAPRPSLPFCSEGRPLRSQMVFTRMNFAATRGDTQVSSVHLQLACGLNSTAANCRFQFVGGKR